MIRFLARLVSSAPWRASSARPHPHRPALRLESLEERLTPTTLFVTNLNDSGAGSLRAEVQAAGNGDVIDFQPGLTGTITLTSGQIPISKSITINGLGASQDVISGNHASRIFIYSVVNTTLTLTGLTLTDGYATGSGGGGGAIQAGYHGLGTDANLDYGDNVVLTNCTISENSATGSGGGVLAYGDVTATNCTFSGNFTSKGAGGGIAAFVNVSVTNCSFIGNSGVDGGGAAVGFNETGYLNANNCVFAGNTATSFNGGAIAVIADLTLNNCTLSGNSAHENGGAISTYDNSVITNCTIANNQAPQGGGLSLATLAPIGSETTQILNTTIADNTATSTNSTGGGGIFVKKGVVLNLSNSIVAGDTDASGKAPDIAGPATANFSLIGNTTGATLGGSNDILNTNPQLGALANNGGAFQTMALLPGSPAINSGSNSLIPGGVTTDERGYPRIAGGTVDMGAYELQTTVTTLTSSPASPSGAITFTATVTFAAGGPAIQGTMNFFINGALVASVVNLASTGQASFTDASPPTSQYNVTAKFVPSDGSIGSEDTLTQSPLVGRRRGSVLPVPQPTPETQLFWAFGPVM